MEQSGRNRTQRGLGIAASVDDDVMRRTATEAEAAGYHSLWLNNPPGAHALSSLGKIAGNTRTIWLGVGVIPLSSHLPHEIVRDVADHRLPLDRFYLGIGSGRDAGGLDRVARGVAAIRSKLDCRLVLAALGPRMCRLAGAQADGVLLNWLTPDFARKSAAWIREGAESAGRPAPRIMTYVRVALGSEAGERLRAEADRYAAIPQYGASFTRMNTPAIGTAISGGSAEEIQHGLAAWDGVVDEVVVRAITGHDTAAELVELLRAAAPTP